MIRSTSTGRAIFSALALCAAAACHHRSSPSSEYVAAREGLEGSDVASAASAGRGGFYPRGSVTTSRIEDLFAGRFAGLDVRRTGDHGISMRLRGVEPLLVIDGLEADPVALVAIPPRSVERIEVLRNVSETALYGSRGVNGVVVVTTRR